MNRKMTLRSAAWLAAAALSGMVLAQQPTAQAPQPVRQAAFDGGPATRPAVSFQRRAARIGDKMEQNVNFDVRLAMSHRRGNQIVEKKQSRVRIAQRRVVNASAVEEDRIAAVEVHYLEATRQLDADQAPGPLEPQPVAGKTYFCRRAGGPEGPLVVTDRDGQTPPQEELEIVQQQMATVGRPNPLAQLLAGRRIAVGERVELPKSVAKQLFNLGASYGDVTQFELMLEKIEPASGGSQHAVFLARVEAASIDSSQMRMQLEGPLVIDAGTCRAVRLSLSGPIGMSETRGSYSTVYQLIGTGQLSTSIDSAYRDAER